MVNATIIFQLMMNDIFQEYMDAILVVYLDDILIFSWTPKHAS